jgi:hypothetical protein
MVHQSNVILDSKKWLGVVAASNDKPNRFTGFPSIVSGGWHAETLSRIYRLPLVRGVLVCLCKCFAILSTWAYARSVVVRFYKVSFVTQRSKAESHSLLLLIRTRTRLPAIEITRRIAQTNRRRETEPHPIECLGSRDAYGNSGRSQASDISCTCVSKGSGPGGKT